MITRPTRILHLILTVHRYFAQDGPAEENIVHLANSTGVTKPVPLDSFDITEENSRPCKLGIDLYGMMTAVMTQLTHVRSGRYARDRRKKAAAAEGKVKPPPPPPPAKKLSPEEKAQKAVKHSL